MASEPILEARHLAKSYSGVTALAGVSLDIAPGEVHALMGENGAGKSTLMKILAGLEPADEGEIRLRGAPVRLRGPHHALRLGIAMIHQELLPFANLSVAENIGMGREPVSAFGWVDRAALRRDAERLTGLLGAPIPADRPMHSLSVAEMQTVEIAKALAHDARVIFMDEPTSAISEREVDALLTVIADLRRRGVAVVYTSHKLGEVFRIADRITVLRDGRHVATAAASELSPDRLIALMVGREVNLPAARAAPIPGEAVLEVNGLGKAGRFAGIRFTLRRGEVLGLAGLMGAGRTEVLSAIAGLAPADRGEIRVRGRAAAIRNPSDALALGIALVSEDRRRFGFVPGMAVRHNLTLASLPRYSRAHWIDRRAESRAAGQQIAALSIRTRGHGQPVRELSGGNQQKVVIGKALLADPDVVLLDEPTRGIDVGAKAEIHALIARLAAEGKAVLLVSSELPEILALSHRILVMRQGAISAELDPRRATQDEILTWAMPQ